MIMSIPGDYSRKPPIAGIVVLINMQCLSFMKDGVNKFVLKLINDFNAEVSSYWCGQIYYRSTFLESSLPDALSYLLEKLWLDGLLGEMNHSTFKILDILSKRWIADSLKSRYVLVDNLWSFLNFQSL